jgi:hypothetical protein
MLSDCWARASEDGFLVERKLEISTKAMHLISKNLVLVKIVVVLGVG